MSPLPELTPANEWLWTSGADGRLRDAPTLLTAVPVNLRPPEARGLASRVGNEVNAMLMHLPIGERDPLRRLAIVRELVAAKRDHPAVGALPALANVLSVLPRPLHRAGSPAFAGLVELIVTNVPGPIARPDQPPRGSPRTRWAMMLRCTSEVPA